MKGSQNDQLKSNQIMGKDTKDENGTKHEKPKYPRIQFTLYSQKLISDCWNSA